ncbi:Zinc finger CCCH-type, partial [Penicillium cf. griseofulvum]
SYLTKEQINIRYRPFVDLAKQAAALSKMIDEEPQPAKRLKDAIALRQTSPDGEGTSISRQLERLRITLGARLISIKAREFVLHEKFKHLNPNSSVEQIPLIVQLNQPTIPFLQDCRESIIKAKEGSLFRIVITAALACAKISELFGLYHRTHLTSGTHTLGKKGRKSTGLGLHDDRRNMAREFLADALHLCDQLCKLSRDTQLTISVIEFSIGECGMSMEPVKCLECGASIGQNHLAVEGIS